MDHLSDLSQNYCTVLDIQIDRVPLVLALNCFSTRLHCVSAYMDLVQRNNRSLYFFPHYLFY